MKLTTSSVDPRIIENARFHGFDVELEKAQEELLELFEALGDFDEERSLEARDHVLEEIADVRIVIDQLEYLMWGEKRCAWWREVKLQRQMKRNRKEREIAYAESVRPCDGGDYARALHRVLEIRGLVPRPPRDPFCFGAWLLRRRGASGRHLECRPRHRWQEALHALFARFTGGR